MIKNKEKIKHEIKKKLDKKAHELIHGLDDLADEEFTIDAIEEIMCKFERESKEIMIATVNEAIASFDERRIIKKKNNKSKVYKGTGVEPKGSRH